MEKQPARARAAQSGLIAWDVQRSSGGLAGSGRCRYRLAAVQDEATLAGDAELLAEAGADAPKRFAGTDLGRDGLAPGRKHPHLHRRRALGAGALRRGRGGGQSEDSPREEEGKEDSWKFEKGKFFFLDFPRFCTNQKNLNEHGSRYTNRLVPAARLRCRAASGAIPD